MPASTTARFAAAVQVAALALLAACGGGDSPTAPGGTPPGGGHGNGGGGTSLSIVRVTPSTASVTAGNTTRLVAAATDASGRVVSGVTVSWISLATDVASVSSDGTVTGRVAGQARIVAQAQGFADTAMVTVEGIAGGSVTVEPATLALRLGTTGVLTASVRDEAGTVVGLPVAWSTDSPATVKVSSIGIVTGVAVGTARIVATRGSRADTSFVTVAPTSVTGILATLAITPSPVSVARGRTVQLTTVARDAQGGLVSGYPLAWRSLTPAVATVSAGGTVSGVAEGSARVVATAGSVADTVTVTVGPPPVASVLVSPRAVTLHVDSSTTLVAVARDAMNNALTGRVISWRSDSPAVANVTATGRVTALSAGVARIIAAAEGRADTSFVTVSTGTTPPAAASVSVSPSPVSLTVGATEGLQATVRDGSGTVAGGTVAWTTSNAAVATVSSTGLVTAVGAGSATITATAGSVSGTAAVTVRVPVRETVMKQATDVGTIGEQDGVAAQLPGVLVAGDDDASDFAPLQAFVTYSLADLPADARIESASLGLTMEPAGVFGNPFGLGGLYVEWASTLSINPMSPSVSSLLVTGTFAATTATDVTSLVSAARAAGASSITFRLRFATPRDNNGATDQLELAADALSVTFSR